MSKTRIDCTGGVLLVNGDARRIPLADGLVQCVVTSPPYWGLRDYGTAEWVGGDEACDHKHRTARNDGQRENINGFHGSSKPDSDKGAMNYRDTCAKCGAIRKDAQLGLEPLHDCQGWATGERCGDCFICHAVAYMREVWRVLRNDGTVFLNIGDSFAGSTQTGGLNSISVHGKTQPHNNHKRELNGLKPKDLCLIPQRLALALQADGWWVRSEIIWHKPNPMPESVTDRPTKSHEQVWLLTKNGRYYWDAEGVKTASKYPDDNRKSRSENGHKRMPNDIIGGVRPGSATYPTRNLRDVWKIATQSYSGAHYATYPEALVERCLKAGTSEKGACVECGKAWVRVVEKETSNRRDYGSVDQFVDLNDGRAGDVQSTTLGWRPDCECWGQFWNELYIEDEDGRRSWRKVHRGERGPTRPCLVFDPFAGSGTTALVAKRMGLSAVGLDLSYQYLKENAWQRIGMNQPALF